MVTGRRRVERRLFDAVLLVLASSGCDQGAKSTPPPPPTPKDNWAPADAAAAVQAPPVDAGVPADAFELIASPPERDLKKLCATRKRVKVDPTGAPHIASGNPVTLGDAVEWDPVKGHLLCTTYRGQKRSGTVTIIHHPRCCPKGMPDPQPPCLPFEMEVEGKEALFERAIFDPKGTLVSAKLGWEVYDAKYIEEPYCGRRPAGLEIDGDPCRDPDDIGGQLAHMAELEAASIPAFERLARELALYGAPAALIRRAERAARDEVRHARMMTKLAARFGATPRAVSVRELPPRALAEIARENAVEGCVRETYGALVATHQAEQAEPSLRRAFAAIARDERRHAALAADVDAWLVTRLAAPEHAALAAARTSALDDLRESLRGSAAVPTLGVPGGARAVALLDAYFA